MSRTDVCVARGIISAVYLNDHLSVIREGTEHDVVGLLDVLPLRAAEGPLRVRSHRFFPLFSTLL